YDAIVIGAGINGLVTAAYLGRAGRRVLVLERRDTVGGSAVTEEFAPGFRGDVLAHDIGWLPPTIAAELGVPDGLLVSPDPAVVTPLPAGGHLALGSDERKTVESIRGLSARDAAQWPEFASRMHRLAGFLE